jgi:UDP-N-acetylglucosamine--N-acetylmuramyl-(pentapeptide) pyrophosphoryl-undecaprenol N-acetylglucosamine transferase
VLGGGQGAKSLNEAVPRALAHLASNMRITHQCGAAHEADARRLYEALGLEARAQVVPFIADMPQALADADLVIARSGASAVSEICAIGRPSLLVPYPFASGDHQRVNAESLVRAGAALCLSSTEATADRIGREITALFEHSQSLFSMAASARALGRPEAAHAIALDLLGIAGVALNERRVAQSPAFDGASAPPNQSSPDSSSRSRLSFGEAV